MDEFKRSYLRFLEQAGDNELIRERARLLELAGCIRQAVPELRWMLRNLEEEIDARLQLQRLPSAGRR